MTDAQHDTTLAADDGEALASWRHHEAEHLVGWALGARHPQGGFGWRDSAGGLVPARGRPLWVNFRMIHSLALGHILGDPRCADPLDQALRDVPALFRDRRHGGWFANADTPGVGPKEAYGQAFVILGAATATIASRPGARQLLDTSLQELVRYFWDENEQMPFDTYDVTFGETEPYRGGNAAMHLVEALLAAADATAERQWLEMALVIAHRMVALAGEHDWRVPEHFHPDWTPDLAYNEDQPRHPFRPFGCTPGHALEWSRLLRTMSGALADPGWIRPAATDLARTAVADGWDTMRSGFCYTTDFTGRPIVTERFHWVVCEAIGAATVLDQDGADASWRTRLDDYWAFTRTRLIDPSMPGGWRHELDEQNQPAARTWYDRPDVYHALQAVLLPDVPAGTGLARGLATRRIRARTSGVRRDI